MDNLIIEEGFYLDPETKRTFYIKKTEKMMLIPPWVKSKPGDWKKVKIQNATIR